MLFSLKHCLIKILKKNVISFYNEVHQSSICNSCPERLREEICRTLINYGSWQSLWSSQSSMHMPYSQDICSRKMLSLTDIRHTQMPCFICTMTFTVYFIISQPPKKSFSLLHPRLLFFKETFSQCYQIKKFNSEFFRSFLLM